MERIAPSVFESFNARALQPSEVARTFVPSDHFDRLARRRHSLVVGPRGSGKTTLLKMLQPAAIEAWEHDSADAYAQQVEFIGVFVPFDRSWRAQIDALAQGRLGREEHSLLGEAAFTAHVYRALITAFRSRISVRSAVREFRRVSILPKQESALAKDLYECWQLPAGSKSLLGVWAALGQRLSEIGQLGRQLAYDDDRSGRPRVGARAELHASFLDGVSAALDAWQAQLERDEERWGLMFDELELAPSSIKRTLYQSLRSRDSRLLFKLALSPFDGDVPIGASPEDPQDGQDFDTITLWFSDKRDTLPFCRDLWNAMLKARELPPVLPKAAFGRSRFETTDVEWRQEASRTAYGPGSRWQRRFSDLESADPTFGKFLSDRQYSSAHLDRIPPASRAAEIRKISPLVEARLFFLRNQGGAGQSRSRKRLTLYAGWESICAVSEGNPRWFIGMVGELLQQADRTRLRLTQPQQAREIEDAAERYRAALRTIPVMSNATRHKSRGLISLLDPIGEYFHREQILAPFSAEPPGSFTVDAGAPQDLIDAVGQALNAGALVLLKSASGERTVGSLTSRRFRLCYLLAAYYNMMPRKGRAVSLGRILSAMNFESRDDVQLTLV